MAAVAADFDRSPWQWRKLMLISRDCDDDSSQVPHYNVILQVNKDNPGCNSDFVGYSGDLMVI